MLRPEEYLPIGSIVELEEGKKKLMIIGIMHNAIDKDKTVKEYDYIGVTYPEGFFSQEMLLLFQQSSVTNVIFRGYEDTERESFLEALGVNIEKAEKLFQTIRENNPQKPADT